MWSPAHGPIFTCEHLIREVALIFAENLESEKFNSDKTKSVVFTNKITHSSLHFNKKAAEDVHQHKHLGLIFNTRLSWKDHVSEVIANVSKLLGIMHKLSRELDRRILDTIYETFIRSTLEYACRTLKQ